MAVNVCRAQSCTETLGSGQDSLAPFSSTFFLIFHLTWRLPSSFILYLVPIRPFRALSSLITNLKLLLGKNFPCQRDVCFRDSWILKFYVSEINPHPSAPVSWFCFEAGLSGKHRQACLEQSSCLSPPSVGVVGVNHHVQQRMDFEKLPCYKNQHVFCRV